MGNYVYWAPKLGYLKVSLNNIAMFIFASSAQPAAGSMHYEQINQYTGLHYSFNHPATYNFHLPDELYPL